MTSVNPPHLTPLAQSRRGGFHGNLPIRTILDLRMSMFRKLKRTEAALATTAEPLVRSISVPQPGFGASAVPPR